MERADYSTLLYAIENYARQINSMFSQFKPHDDRFPEEQRADALYSCFYILKESDDYALSFCSENYHKIKESLNLDESQLSIDELGKAIEAGHKIGEIQEYFPSAE